MITLSLDTRSTAAVDASAQADEVAAGDPTGAIEGTDPHDSMVTTVRWRFGGGFATDQTQPWFVDAAGAEAYIDELRPDPLVVPSHGAELDLLFNGHHRVFSTDSVDADVDNSVLGWSSLPAGEAPDAFTVGAVLTAPYASHDRSRLWAARMPEYGSALLPRLAAVSGAWGTVGDEWRAATLEALAYVQCVGASDRLPAPAPTQGGWIRGTPNTYLVLRAATGSVERLRVVWSEFGEPETLRRAREVLAPPSGVPDPGAS